MQVSFCFTNRSVYYWKNIALSTDPIVYLLIFYRVNGSNSSDFCFLLTLSGISKLVPDIQFAINFFLPFFPSWNALIWNHHCMYNARTYHCISSVFPECGYIFHLFFYYSEIWWRVPWKWFHQQTPVKQLRRHRRRRSCCCQFQRLCCCCCCLQ